MTEPRATRGPAAPWSPLDRALGLVLALFFGGAIAWVAHPYYDEVNDAALYVLTGHALATGEGYSYLGEPFVVRPPGFSALLAPFLTGDEADFALLNFVVAAFGALGAWLVFALFRARLGGALAAAVAILVWTNPAWQRLSSQVLSDVPGATLGVLCLWLDERARQRPTWGRHVGIGLALAAAVWLRTMNVLLVPAIALGRALARDRGTRTRPTTIGRPLVALALPIVAYAPWLVRNASVTTAARPEQLSLHSYWTALWHVDPGDPSSATITFADFVARCQQQLEQTLIVLGRRMGETGDVGLAHVVALVVLGLVAVELVRRRSAVELTASAFAAVLVLYFVLRPRLVLPLWLLATPIAIQGIVALAERFARSERARRRLRHAVAIAVAIAAGLEARPRGWLDDVATIDRDRRAAALALRAQVPPGSAAVAGRGWHWGVHALDRDVWSVQYLAKRTGAFEALTTIARREGARVCALDVSTPIGATLTRALQPGGPPFARFGRFVLFRLDR